MIITMAALGDRQAHQQWLVRLRERHPVLRWMRLVLPPIVAWLARSSNTQRFERWLNQQGSAVEQAIARSKGVKQPVPIILGDYVMGSMSLTHYLEIYQILVSPQAGVQRWFSSGIPLQNSEKGADFVGESSLLLG
jgi:hypothetical protein